MRLIGRVRAFHPTPRVRVVAFVVGVLWLTNVTGWAWTNLNNQHNQIRRTQSAQAAQIIQVRKVAAQANRVAADLLQTRAAARHAQCVADQRLYDAFPKFTRDFLAPEFRATPAEVRAALAHLRVVLGERPVCR